MYLVTQAVVKLSVDKFVADFSKYGLYCLETKDWIDLEKGLNVKGTLGEKNRLLLRVRFTSLSSKKKSNFPLFLADDRIDPPVLPRNGPQSSHNFSQM